ncbi:MAG: BMP family ABC transporter substrate-binding protein [Spirochaetaceae bacterium]|jgi:simple sugar transport system substrate-binding protein|nr:BMP family ABC transporter substrate-binding protein [Spirochaetaceae bacterium]
MLAFSCARKDEGVASKGIAVFIPGVLSGSPTYELLVKGVRAGLEGVSNIELTVIEAGFNQAEWETKLSAAAASEKYELIISSNPSLPDIANRVSAKFPKTKYMIFDGELSGNPSIYTLNYDKRAQAYALGTFAALLSAEMDSRTAGLISAQHYPVMDEQIMPSYLEGARSINPAMDVDFRIVGHWSDPDKALELADDMISGGIKVILTIAGAGNEGVVQAAAKRGAKVLWFDTNAYSYRPGVIAGCCATYQDKAAEVKIREYLNGELRFGVCQTLGFREGYIDFIEDDPLYTENISENVRKKQAEIVAKLRE